MNEHGSSDDIIYCQNLISLIFYLSNEMNRVALVKILIVLARCIFEGLQYNTILVNLNLSQTGITATDPDTARSLTKMLQVNKSLTHLNLSNNDTFSDSGARCIFEDLQNNTTLVNLNLSQTGITATDPGTVRSLTKMFQVNNSLTHLDFSNNNDLGADCIFEGLQHNTCLVNLNLSKIGISATDPDTARSLTKMLQVNKSLTHLNLSNNGTFSDSGARCIFEGLQHNTTLVYLNLSQTDNTSLCYLDLHVVSSVMYLHADTAAEHIAQALKSNRSLQTLNIVGWKFLGHNGIHPILESLMFNSTLQTLYIGKIDSETLSSFKRARETKNLPPIEIHESYK